MDDKNLIGFWHLDQVRPVNEECPEYAIATEPHLFVFADYSIWAHAYAIRLASGVDADTAIFVNGLAGNRALKIAATFEEFLVKYAAGDQRMLFPEIINN